MEPIWLWLTKICIAPPLYALVYSYSFGTVLFFEGSFAMIRWESRNLHRYGYFIPWQDLQVTLVRPSAFEGSYPRKPRWFFGELEVGSNMFVELPPVVTYLGAYLLHDPKSRYWNVFVTVWMARVAAYVMVELYSNYGLFQIPKMFMTQSLNLDLADVLGSRDAADDYKEMLYLILVVDFDNVPPDHYAKTSGVAQNQSDGVDANEKSIRPAGIYRFIWFEPCTFKQVPQGRAALLKNNHGNRSRPDNQLHGFVYKDLNGRQTDLWHVSQFPTPNRRQTPRRPTIRKELLLM